MKLIITLDKDGQTYILDTPEGPLDFEFLGQVIADLMLRFFDPDNPPDISDDGTISLEGSNVNESKLESVIKSKKNKGQPN